MYSEERDSQLEWCAEFSIQSFKSSTLWGCDSFCMLHGDVSRCVFVCCAGLVSCQWSDASDVLFNTPLSLRLSWSSSHCQSVTGSGANLGPETLFTTMLAARHQSHISLYEAENRSRSCISMRWKLYMEQTMEESPFLLKALHCCCHVLEFL